MPDSLQGQENTMLGTLRLAPAVMVAFSHSGVSQEPLWLGVVALVIFMNSGSAMTALIEKRFGSLSMTPSFYLERAVRLAPQYYFWLAISIVVAFLTPWTPVKITSDISYNIFAYLMIAPLGLQFYILLIETHILHQATSLWIEMTFYELSPFILRNHIISWIFFIIFVTLFAIYAIPLVAPNFYM